MLDIDSEIRRSYRAFMERVTVIRGHSHAENGAAMPLRTLQIRENAEKVRLKSNNVPLRRTNTEF